MPQIDVALLQGERRVLEMVATGASLRDTIEALIALIEDRERDLLCGVLVLAPGNASFSDSFGPSFPLAYHNALTGLSIAPPYAGACAESAHRGVQIFVPNISDVDCYSQRWHDVLTFCNLAAVRATPINASDGSLLGCFAMYSRHVGAPQPSDPRMPDIAEHLASIALERSRDQRTAAAREARLLASAGQFAHMIESAPFGIYVVDGDLRLAQASRTARSAFGIAGLVGMDLGDALRKMWPQRFADEATARFRHTLATGEPYIARNSVGRRADIGAVEAYDWRTERILMPDGRFGVVCYFYDISDRQRAEMHLRNSEARFRAAIDAVNGVLWTNNAIGEMEGEQPGWAALTGQTQQEYQGFGWSGAVHPDDAEPTIVAWKEAVAQRRVFVFEHRVRRHDGLWRRHSIRAIPIMGDDDAVREWVGVHTDVTDQRDAQEVLTRSRDELERMVEERTGELAATQARLAHAQRMEALGQLAGGIAHDFNNVLQIVQGGAQRIESKTGDPVVVRRLARSMLEAASRGSAITRRLLAFSRQGDLRTELVDPASLLGELREILAYTLGAGIAVHVDAPKGTLLLHVDKSQLETVLINVATNARDAMESGGVLTLKAVAEELPKADRPLPMADLNDGTYVRISVSDTGTGMAPEVLARVTEPFFTTKPQGRGTGLGLAMARGFIAQSGGTMLIESHPGQGTTVNLWLPLANGTSTTEHPRETGGVVERGKSARLIVVDDEPLVLEVLTQQLEASGYTVLPACGPKQALALLDLSGPVDLIVADLSMPGMDGIALLREVNQRHPQIPAILLTGFATSAAETAMADAAAGRFTLIRKPVTEQALAREVATLLERQTGA